MVNKKLIDIIFRLKQSGYDFSVVYDIGAHKGEWTVAMRQILPESKFYAFEANPHMQQFLVDAQVSYYVGISLSSEENDRLGMASKLFYFAKPEVGDSCYRERTTHYNDPATMYIDTRMLNKLMLDYHIPPPNFVKVTTNGSELDVLRGADYITTHTNLILCEVPMIQYNDGAPNMQEYFDFFKSKNYLPIDITSVQCGEDILLKIRVLFMKRNAKEKYLIPTTTIAI